VHAKKQKFWLIAVIIVVVAVSVLLLNWDKGRIASLSPTSFFEPSPACVVPQMVSSQDQNRNGVPDS